MLGMYLALIDEPSDKEKFSKIYNEYKDMMFQKAYLLLNNSALAEEAVQESLLKIAKNIHKISEPVCSKTAAFIVIIVRNTCYDILKKEKNVDILSLDENIETLNISFPDVEQAIVGIGFNGIVKLICCMDKIYSDVMKLKYIYGYSSKEIAEILNITSKNAEMRLYRGKQILKSMLEEDGNVIK